MTTPLVCLCRNSGEICCQTFARAEFAPTVGTLTVVFQSLGVSVRVSMRGAGVAVIEFWRE